MLCLTVSVFRKGTTTPMCTKISHGLGITILKSSSFGVTMNQVIFDASLKGVPANAFQRFLRWEVFQDCVNVFCIFNFSCKYSHTVRQSEKMDLYCLLNRWARLCSRLQFHGSLHTHVKWKSDTKKMYQGVPQCFKPHSSSPSQHCWLRK